MPLQNKPSHLNEKIQRAQGALLGLACGDALGTTLEFKPKDSYIPLTDMVGGGPFKLRPGQWTDDTSMMLCLAESLIKRDGNELNDQIRRYIAWYKEGIHSSTGFCFDIGNTVRAALERYLVTVNARAGSTSESSAGNGSLMRIAPIALFYHDQHELVAMDAAAESSKTTHGEQRCIEACELMTLLIHRLLNVQCIPEKQVFLKKAFADFLVYRPHCHSDIRSILDGELFKKTRSQVHGTGFVIASLEAALWCFIRSHSFEAGALLAANLGDDADTTAAIFGQLAGAYYGMSGIPEKWLSILHRKSDISDIAASLVQRRDIQEVDRDVRESVDRRKQAAMMRLIESGKLRVTGSIKDVEAFGRFIRRKAAELISCPPMGYSITFEHPLEAYEVLAMDKLDQALEITRTMENEGIILNQEKEITYENVLNAVKEPRYFTNKWNPDTKVALYQRQEPLFELNIGDDLQLICNIPDETEIQQVILFHQSNVNRANFQRTLNSMMKQWVSRTVPGQQPDAGGNSIRWSGVFSQKNRSQFEDLIHEPCFDDVSFDNNASERMGGMGIANAPEGIHIWEDVFHWQGSHEGYWERTILKTFPHDAELKKIQKAVLAAGYDADVCENCLVWTMGVKSYGRCSGCNDLIMGIVY